MPSALRLANCETSRKPLPGRQLHNLAFTKKASIVAGIPRLTVNEVAALVPSATDIHPLGKGGQKLVFRCQIEGQSWALKFSSIDPSTIDQSEDLQSAQATLRAQRELDTMQQVCSPHMVKPGPLPLTILTHQDEQLLCFTEELIEGDDLRVLFNRQGRLSVREIVQLGTQIAEAIHSLWSLKRIHRDIKPANIMRRTSTGEFVLLDAGLVLDIEDISLSVAPVGTPLYFSPEQFEFLDRRTVMDFRSDLFSLGVTMYELLTGHHPFYEPNDRSQDVYDKIRNHQPPPPSALISDVPAELDEILLRMLAKAPHARYRNCTLLIDRLNLVPT